MTTVICVPDERGCTATVPGDLEVLLYGHTQGISRGSVGGTVRTVIERLGIVPAPRAWDLLSIALSVIAADVGVRRTDSPDGWTRQINLRIAVSDPAFWTTQRDLFNQQLRFLTTDIWDMSFIEGGLQPKPAKPATEPDQDCVVLLSGGLDSLIGAIDLVKAHGRIPYAVSQVSLGDKRKQSFFASRIGGGLAHLQLNHNAECPGQNERSQRARSIAFLAYGVLVATALKRYHAGDPVTLFVCENGFISLNPPLTVSRLGGLSTRTTHPVFIRLFQQMLENAGLRVTIENPYQYKTKGEMLLECADQQFLRTYAHISTSCGRFARNGYTHCGRCLPCIIRRAAYHKWGLEDRTPYVFADLSQDDRNHSRYDDVRSAAMAVSAAKIDGLRSWAGPALSTALLGDVIPYRDVVEQGLEELEAFLKAVGVL